MVDAMSVAAPTPLRLILDLDPRSESPAGTLTGGSGASAPFSGWVSLTRAIELALAAERGDGDGAGRENAAAGAGHGSGPGQGNAAPTAKEAP